MRSSLKPSALAALLLALTACDKEKLPEEPVDETPYVAPAPVQLTPPPGVNMQPGDPPLVRFKMERERVQVDVEGNAYRPIQLVRADDAGHYKLLLVTSNDNTTVELDAPGYHLLPTGATAADGTMMICWNTLTGTTSEYSPTTPDPARGMALHCRSYKDGVLSPITQIRVPTVGCWIRRLVALPDGGFRLLYKGDDGWFEGSDKPTHGVYESRFMTHWSTPTLLIPNPSVDTE